MLPYVQEGSLYLLALILPDLSLSCQLVGLIDRRPLYGYNNVGQDQIVKAG